MQVKALSIERVLCHFHFMAIAASLGTSRWQNQYYYRSTRSSRVLRQAYHPEVTDKHVQLYRF